MNIYKRDKNDTFSTSLCYRKYFLNFCLTLGKFYPIS